MVLEDMWSNAPKRAFKDRKSLEVGDIIEFGRYPQDVVDGKFIEKPIECICLDRDAKSSLLISRYVLDCIDWQNYCDGEFRDINWDNSVCRDWLNNYFINKAFNDEERKLIVTSHNINMPNPDYDTPGCSPTDDKVFLLSILEVEACFRLNMPRAAKATQYADEQYVMNDDITGYATWLLRSNGHNKQSLALVAGCDFDDFGDVIEGSGGELWTDGNYPNEGDGIRPAWRIRLI